MNVPQEVIRYVDREVYKEVPVEVIKEVPVEVVQEVVKEVIPREVLTTEWRVADSRDGLYSDADKREVAYNGRQGNRVKRAPYRVGSYSKDYAGAPRGPRVMTRWPAPAPIPIGTLALVGRRDPCAPSVLTRPLACRCYRLRVSTVGGGPDERVTSFGAELQGGVAGPLLKVMSTWHRLTRTARRREGGAGMRASGGVES